MVIDQEYFHVGPVPERKGRWLTSLEFITRRVFCSNIRAVRSPKACCRICVSEDNPVFARRNRWTARNQAQRGRLDLRHRSGALFFASVTLDDLAHDIPN